MTQGEVMKLLKKNKKGLTIREIGEIFDCSRGALSTNMAKLIKQKDVKSEKVKAERGYTYVYSLL